MVFLGDIDRTRRLSGNPSSSNVTNQDITTGLEYGTSRVYGLTGKTDWITDTVHKDYATAVMAAEYYASSMIRDRFQDQANISTEHYNRANELLTAVTSSLATGAGGGNPGSATTRYRSYPLNNSALAYRSLQGAGQELVGTAGGYEVP